MKPKFVVDGAYYFPDLKSASRFANHIFEATGVIVSVEAV